MCSVRVCVSGGVLNGVVCDVVMELVAHTRCRSGQGSL